MQSDRHNFSFKLHLYNYLDSLFSYNTLLTTVSKIDMLLKNLVKQKSVSDLFHACYNTAVFKKT